MPVENKRLLLELERTIRKVNKEEINSLIPSLTLDKVEPMLAMVARARGQYLQALFDLSRECGDSAAPTDSQMQQLRIHRATFEELLQGVQSFQTAVERGYLEVEG